MVSVAEAEKIVLEHLFSPSSKKVALADANGKILAEEIAADRDFPPFDRAAMDGIAISFDEFEKGKRESTREASTEVNNSMLKQNELTSEPKTDNDIA